MKLSKYQEVAKRILAIPEGKYTINMDEFCSIEGVLIPEHPCGTTYCLVGILAHEDGYPERYHFTDDDGNARFDYCSYSIDISGADVHGTKWDYLFGMLNPDSLESAKERAEYVLENDTYFPMAT